MPSQTASFLLLDFLVYCLIAVAIAMPLYHFVRKSSPELGWNYHGNVPTTHLGPLDILGVSVALILPMLNIILAPFMPRELMEKAASEPGLSTIIANVISQFFFAGVVVLFIVFRANILDVFGLRHANWKRIAIAIAGGLACIYVVAPIVGYFAGLLLEKIGEGTQPQVAVQMILDAKKNNPTLLVGLAIMACVVAPICEEILFRGYLYGLLKRYSCRFFAALISGLIFGLIHASLTSLAPLVVVGIFLAIIYEFSGSLWAPIITHSIFNTVNVMAMIFFVNEADLPY